MPPVGLFGILTYNHDVRAPGAPAALFLNVANQHHVGPNRLWVELARQWAGAGIRSLRLDLSGLGDSPDRQGASGRWECFKPEAFEDVADAAQWLSPDDPSNVVLVGLCSGGYQALEGALVLRARGVVAINPFGSFDPAEFPARPAPPGPPAGARAGGRPSRGCPSRGCPSRRGLESRHRRHGRPVRLGPVAK